MPPSPWIRPLQVPGGFDVADERIAMRNFIESLCSNGVETGDSAFSSADRQAFANQVDRLLAKRK